MDVLSYMQSLGQAAREASRAMAKASTDNKNRALLAIAQTIESQRDAIKAANAEDMVLAQKNGLDAALLDRLELNDERIDAMIEGLQQVAALTDPVGEITGLKFLPSGIQVGQMRVPLGVVGIIYESRPNVTIEAASLCLKSGNAAILRGGSEAIEANRVLAECIRTGLASADLPAAAVQVVDTIDRAAVGALITMPEFVDVIVPRGGKGLIERISKEAKVPVIKHLDGVCHVYLDEFADKTKAINITINAKTHRNGTCNTLETLLVHEKVAAEFLPELSTALLDLGVELRGCDATQTILSKVKPATEEDWFEEYLGPILAIKIVKSLDDAIAHINHYGSHHTDSIISENYSLSRRFLTEVDSSSVMINASTRFADGFEYGLGAEIGISTDKIHARGPVGLEGLTSQKYVVLGNGEIRK